MQQLPKTNSKSIVALVLGMLLIVVPYLGFFIGIVSIVYASLSFKEIKKNGEEGRHCFLCHFFTNRHNCFIHF